MKCIACIKQLGQFLLGSAIIFLLAICILVSIFFLIQSFRRIVRFGNVLFKSIAVFVVPLSSCVLLAVFLISHPQSREFYKSQAMTINEGVSIVIISLFSLLLLSFVLWLCAKEFENFYLMKESADGEGRDVARGRAAHVDRFEASRTKALTGFVGREHEVSFLTDRWRGALEGEGHVVLLCGEAGIGKSRTIAELRKRIGEERSIVVRYQCST